MNKRATHTNYMFKTVTVSTFTVSRKPLYNLYDVFDM